MLLFHRKKPVLQAPNLKIELCPLLFMLLYLWKNWFFLLFEPLNFILQALSLWFSQWRFGPLCLDILNWMAVHWLSSVYVAQKVWLASYEVIICEFPFLWVNLSEALAKIKAWNQCASWMKAHYNFSVCLKWPIRWIWYHFNLRKCLVAWWSSRNYCAWNILGADHGQTPVGSKQQSFCWFHSRRQSSQMKNHLPSHMSWKGKEAENWSCPESHPF